MISNKLHPLEKRVKKSEVFIFKNEAVDVVCYNLPGYDYKILANDKVRVNIPFYSFFLYCIIFSQ